MPTKRKLRAVKDAQGVLPGLFECDICRIEKRDDGWWRTQVPLRTIGNSSFSEFRSLDRGGVWMDIGAFKVKALAVAAAERLESGVYVWQHPARNELGRIPGQIVEFKEAAEAIRAGQ